MLHPRILTGALILASTLWRVEVYLSEVAASIAYVESWSMKRMSSPRGFSPFSHRVLSAVLTGESFGVSRLPASDEEAEIIPADLIRELVTGFHGKLAKPVISIHGIIIDGDIDLSYCEWRGRLDLGYCRVQGSLSFAHAVIRGRVCLDGAALAELEMQYAVIDGPFSFRDGSCSRGLFGLGMTVSGAFNLRRTELWAPVDKPNRCAVELYRARLGDVYLMEAKLHGGLYGNGITVDRNLRLQSATFSSREAMGWEMGPDSGGGAVSLASAAIGSVLYISRKDPDRPAWQVDGRVNLTRLSCTTLRVEIAHLAGIPLVVEHLKYGRLAGVTPQEWLTLLARMDGVGTQPYLHLAAYCGELGAADLQRKVLIAQQRRVTSELGRRSVERWRRKLWSWSVEYGYKPGRAIVWLVVCTLICAVILVAGGGFLVHQTSSPANKRGVSNAEQAIAVAMDNVLPFADLGVADKWEADPVNVSQTVWLSLFVTLKLLGWTMAALGLAAVTGVMKKP